MHHSKLLNNKNNTCHYKNKIDDLNGSFDEKNITTNTVLNMCRM